jgi:hypothetical protein
MKEAGFVSVEAGLQSTNPASLKAIHRPFHKERFLEGAKCLMQQGIKVTTGLILGLPHDSLEDFRATLEFVKEAGLDGDAEVYPLAVLPGTKIRSEAKDFGIEYGERPPYWIAKTDAVDEQEFLEAEAIVEDLLGRRLFQDVQVFMKPNNFRHCIDARGVFSIPEQAGKTANYTILLTPEDIPLWIRYARTQSAVGNPHSLRQFVIESFLPPDESLLIGLSDAFFDPSGFAERMHCWDLDIQGRFGTRIFWLTSDIKNVTESYDGFAEIIFDARGAGSIPPDLAENRLPVLSDKKNYAMLCEAYAGDEELVLGLWE